MLRSSVMGSHKEPLALGNALSRHTTIFSLL